MIPDFVYTILWIIGFIVTIIAVSPIIRKLYETFVLSPKEREKRLIHKVSVLKAKNLFNSSVYEKIDINKYIFTRSDRTSFTFFNKHWYSLNDYWWYFKEWEKYLNYNDPFTLAFQKLLLNDENTNLSQRIKENHRLKMLSLQAELNQAKIDAISIKRNDFSETFEKAQWYLSKGKAIDNLRKEILVWPPK